MSAQWAMVKYEAFGDTKCSWKTRAIKGWEDYYLDRWTGLSDYLQIIRI